MPKLFKNDKDRILNNITIDENTGCWNWTKLKNHLGYGVCSYKNIGRGAHRVSYTIFVGEIPENMMVLHRCDNRACVNPEHLWIGTQDDNMKDMAQKGRSRKGKHYKVNRKKLTKPQTEKMVLLFGVKRYKEIAKMFSVSVGTVYSIKKEYGLTKPRTENKVLKTKKGGLINSRENHPCAKLTLAQVEEIRAKLQQGCKQCEMSRQYNVSTTAIFNIAKGNRWAGGDKCKRVLQDAMQ